MEYKVENTTANHGLRQERISKQRGVSYIVTISVCLSVCRASKSCDHATAQSRKSFQRLRKIWVLNAKMHNLPLVHLFWVSFQFLCWFLGYLICAKLWNGNIGRAKQFAFRRSVCLFQRKTTTCRCRGDF